MLPSLSHLLTTFSSHIKAAIYTKHLSGNISSPRPGKKSHKLGDFVAGAKTAQGYRMKKILLHLGGQLSSHFGFDETRGNRIYGNTPRGDFPGHGLGESNNACFGGGIQRLARITYLPYHR